MGNLGAIESGRRQLDARAGEPMRTISLDEDAYYRLKAWRQAASESFFSVVKRAVPPRGSLGAFLAFVERRATATKSGNDVMKTAVESGWTLRIDSETKLKKNASGEEEAPAGS